MSTGDLTNISAPLQENPLGSHTLTLEGLSWEAMPFLWVGKEEVPCLS